MLSAPDGATQSPATASASAKYLGPVVPETDFAAIMLAQQPQPSIPVTSDDPTDSPNPRRAEAYVQFEERKRKRALSDQAIVADGIKTQMPEDLRQIHNAGLRQEIRDGWNAQLTQANQMVAAAKEAMTDALNKDLTILIAARAVKDAKANVTAVAQLPPQLRRVEMPDAQSYLSGMQTQFKANADLQLYTPDQVDAALRTVMTNHPGLANSDVAQSLSMRAQALKAKLPSTPMQDIDAVNNAGIRLQQATQSGMGIPAARKAYDDALVTEISDASVNSEGARPPISGLLQDPQALQAAMRQVVADHPGESYDPHFAASITAAVIIQRGEYAAATPADRTSDLWMPPNKGDMEQAAEQASIALQTIGASLQAVPDPDGSIRAAVLSDPRVIQYSQNIVDVFNYKTEGHPVPFLTGETVQTIARSSPDVASLLVDTALGTSPSPDRTKLLQDIRAYAQGNPSQPASAAAQTPSSPVPASGAIAPPAGLTAATDKAWQAYQQSVASGNVQDQSRTLGDLHSALAQEVNAVDTNLQARDPSLSAGDARGLAIRLVTTEYHKENTKDLQTATDAAMVISDAEGAGQGANSGPAGFQAFFKTLANGPDQAQAGGLSLYGADPSVTAQVLADPSVKQWLNSALAATPKSPADALHYMAQLANACSGSTPLAGDLVNQALPRITNSISQLQNSPRANITPDEIETVIQASSDIVSSVRDDGGSVPGAAETSSDSEKITDAIAGPLSSFLGSLTRPGAAAQTPDLPAFITTWVMQSIGTQGTDPTLLIKMADLQSDPAMKSAIYRGIAAGVDQFYTRTFPAATQALGKSVEELTNLNANFGQLVDQNDPTAMQKYVNFVNKYYHDHPDIAQNAAALEEISIRAMNIMTAVGNHQDALKQARVSDQVNNSVENFTSDQNNVTVLLSSPGVANYFAQLPGRVNETFNARLVQSAGVSLRSFIQRGGSVAAKKVAVKVVQLLREGKDPHAALLEFDKFEESLSKYGLSEKLYEAQYAKLTVRASVVAVAWTDGREAWQQLQLETDPVERAILQEKLNQAEVDLTTALKDVPSLPTTWDGSTATGWAIRGGGVAFTVASLIALLNSSNTQPGYKLIAGIGGGLSAAQTTFLLVLMFARGLEKPDPDALSKADPEAGGPEVPGPGGLRDPDALPDPDALNVSSLNKPITWLDKTSDYLSLFGPVLSGYAAYADFNNGKWPNLGVDVISGTSGLATVGGSGTLRAVPLLKWLPEGKSPVGLLLSRFGLWGTLAAAAVQVGDMGFEQWRTVVNSNRFENGDTQRFLHDVIGIDNSPGHDLTWELRNSTKQGFGAGVMIQAAAGAAGYDLSNPADLAVFKHYLNSLTQQQAHGLIAGAHSLIDNMNAKSQPTSTDVSGTETQSKFLAYLHDHNVPLPPPRLAPLAAPALLPAPAPQQLVVLPLDGLNVRSSPALNPNNKIGALYNGSFLQTTGIVRADNQGNNWIEVQGRDSNGQSVQGWVEQQSVTPHPQGAEGPTGRINPELDRPGYQKVPVMPGDSIWDIAARNNINFNDVIVVNSGHIIDRNMIFPGDEVYLQSIPARSAG